jgi:hypothetical protein
MAKKFTQAQPSAWSDLSEMTKHHNELNDCSVKAVAVLAELPYGEALYLLNDRGRKPRHGTFNGTACSPEVVLQTLGFKVTRVDPQEIIQTYPKPRQRELQCITTYHPTKFAAQWPAGKFLLFVRGHVVAVVDGVIHDWTVGRSKQVFAVYRVE